MDLSTIITHLDNFVTTWEGWGKVFEGLNSFIGFENFSSELSSLSELTSSEFEGISSAASSK
ncbi:hypothetical protein [Corynebacterium flavescens]|uniref:hypothetical protein n=1 Tax=Corynebacterium flavescens TaxID=28028 RepID=UPI003FCF5E29